MKPDDKFKEIFSFPPIKERNEEEEYEKFVESMVVHCHCCERNRPCDGVLAGGICDNVQDSDRVDEFDADEYEDDGSYDHAY